VELAEAYELDPKVALRPEPFGALAYHFDTRRLSFLRSPDIVAVVRALAEHPSAEAALDACEIAVGRRPSFASALATLEESGMIRRRLGETEVARVA
jgi:putative mycofactocin binding protein MftB